jgi:hypothetical protein
MLAQMEGKLGVHHSGELRRETAEAKAERIVAEELARADSGRFWDGFKTQNPR